MTFCCENYFPLTREYFLLKIRIEFNENNFTISVITINKRQSNNNDAI